MSDGPWGTDEEQRQRDARWAADAQEKLAATRDEYAASAREQEEARRNAPGRAPGPRPITGPKRNYVGCLGGLGLLGILITVAIMAVLWSRSAEQVGSVLPDDDVEVTLPDGSSTDPTTAASAMSCDTERSTLETAMMAYEIDTGAAAVTLQEIVDHGFLVADQELRYELDPQGALVGTGECAGM